MNQKAMAKFLMNAKYGSVAINARQSGKTMSNFMMGITSTLQCENCTTFYYRNAKGWMTYCNDCHLHADAPHLVALALEVRKGASRIIVWDEFPNGVVVMKDDYWMWEQIDGDRFHEWKP